MWRNAVVHHWASAYARSVPDIAYRARRTLASTGHRVWSAYADGKIEAVYAMSVPDIAYGARRQIYAATCGGRCRNRGRSAPYAMSVPDIAQRKHRSYAVSVPAYAVSVPAYA
eukprot:1565285-Rhodomonas_salina.1